MAVINRIIWHFSPSQAFLSFLQPDASMLPTLTLLSVS
jgi:hypothetical protein